MIISGYATTLGVRLRVRENPQVMEYLKAENAYTEQVLQPHAEQKESLFQELKARVKEDDDSVPVKKDDYYYYSRVAAGQQYAIHCRKLGDLNSPEQIILDENQLADGFNLLQLCINHNYGIFKLISANQRNLILV